MGTQEGLPRITVAEHAGACFGVERALKLVAEVAERSGGPVRTLGPLIHNPTVVAELERAGVSVASEVPASGSGTLVLRTHGVTPEVEALARELGLEVVDATCPYVKRVHRAAEKLAAEGWQVIVVGEQGHPEVEAILGHAPGAIAVADVEALEDVELGRRVGVVVQTTQAKATLDAVVCALMARVAEVRVVNTICEATSERQQAAAALARQCDAMVVIGGRNSANTTRLAQICAAACPATHHIEGPDELRGAWFSGASHIGVSAGASTPSSQIESCVAAIRALVREGMLDC